MEIGIELPDDLMHRAQIVAAQRGLTFSELMIEALEMELAANIEPSGDL